MAVSDPVADMLTKLRNASRAGFEAVDVLPSKLKLEVISLLNAEGYLKDFQNVTVNGKAFVRVFLKYDENHCPVIHEIERISKPGKRVYSGYKDMPRIKNGFGTIVVSTSSGVFSGKKASEKKVGGELICSVW